MEKLIKQKKEEESKRRRKLKKKINRGLKVNEDHADIEKDDHLFNKTVFMLHRLHKVLTNQSNAIDSLERKLFFIS